MQSDLADRQVDLVSYERVIADMTRRNAGPLITGLMTILRDAVRQECEDLDGVIAAQKKSIADLEAPTEALST